MDGSKNCKASTLLYQKKPAKPPPADPINIAHKEVIVNLVILAFAFVDDVVALFRKFLGSLSYQNRHDRETLLFEQSHFLLLNVFDDDVNCPIARQELKLAQKSSSKLESVMHLYAAYVAFSEFARDAEDRGYEVQEAWLQKLNSANQHIFEKLLPLFGKYEQTLLYHNFPRLYRATAQATYHFDDNDKIVAGNSEELDGFKLLLE